MIAFVTGATGFIGSRITHYLIEQGYAVQALVRRGADLWRLANAPIEAVWGDIMQPDSFAEAVKDADLVCVASGILGGWGVPEERYWAVNTQGTENVLRAAAEGRPRRVLHISSAGVVGPLAQPHAVAESTAYAPSNAYERSKCEAEKVALRYFKQGLPLTIIRPEFVFGPGDLHLLGFFQAVQNGHFFYLNGGRSLLHPTYIDDLIQGVHKALHSESAIGEVYFIVGERPLSVRELVTTIAEELGVRPPRLSLPAGLARIPAKVMERAAQLLRFAPPLTEDRVKFFTEHRAFDYSKASEELGYAPQFSFREGVRQTIAWYREKGYL